MEFNKIAAALLITVLAVMVIGKIGDFLVPAEVAHTEGGPIASAGGGQQTEGPPPEGPFTDYLAEADAEQGQRLANACVSCHTFNDGGANRVGPNLYAVVGREIGSVDGFNYSSGLADSAESWDYQTLFDYLRNPQEVFAGSRMGYRMPSPQQRASVVLYLRSLGSGNMALPEPTSPEEASAEEGGEGVPDEGESGEAGEAEAGEGGEAQEGGGQEGSE